MASAGIRSSAAWINPRNSKSVGRRIGRNPYVWMPSREKKRPSVTPTWRSGTGMLSGSSSRKTSASVSKSVRSGSLGPGSWRTNSSSTSSPTASRSSPIRTSGPKPGRARPSSSSSISLGTTLILSPPRTIVAFTVFRSIGSNLRVRSPSRRSARPARRGFSSASRATRCVAGSADCRLHPADLLLGDLDRIEALARDFVGEPAELAERVAHAVEEMRMLLDEESRAEVTARLLVAEDGEDQVAARAEPFRLGAQERRHEHGDAALHVERPAAPDVAVHQLATERWVLPPLVGRRDDVNVAVEEKRGA